MKNESLDWKMINKIEELTNLYREKCGGMESGIALDGDDVDELLLMVKLYANWHQGNLTDREYESMKAYYEANGWIEDGGLLKLNIGIGQFLDGEHQEELEDKIKEVIEEFGVSAKLKSSTGNEITVIPEDGGLQVNQKGGSND